MQNVRIRVQTEPFDTGGEIARLHDGAFGVGAVASFVGVVRDENDGRTVGSMLLEHYPGMTERAIEGIVADARARWAIEAATVIHRVGSLAPGDPIVLVAVASSHRGEAFAACELIMDFLKTRAPFWKKESTPEGGRWVGTRGSDFAALDRWQAQRGGPPRPSGRRRRCGDDGREPGSRGATMTRFFTEDSSAETVIARLNTCPDPRFRQIMESAVRHLHAFVKEVEPTMEEWRQAIEFLTATGRMCDDKRQEWILLSDTLGVSMLVETLNHRARDGRTEATVLGPFHVDGARVEPMGADICRDGKGDPCVVSGRVTDREGRPIEGAVLDVWQTNGEGRYDVQQPDEQPPMNMRARFVTPVDGRYWFRTAKPVSYPVPTDGPVGRMLEATGRHAYRPAHIHFIVSAAGFAPVVTHIFAEGDPYIDSDAVFGVKESLIVPFIREKDAVRARDLGVNPPFWTAEFDFRLAADG